MIVALRPSPTSAIVNFVIETLIIENLKVSATARVVGNTALVYVAACTCVGNLLHMLSSRPTVLHCVNLRVLAENQIRIFYLSE